MNTKNILKTMLPAMALITLLSCRADERVNVNGIIWKDKGIYWGAETNHIKAGLWIRYSSNVTNQTLLQLLPVIYNGSASNDIAAYPVGGAFLWLPPLSSRYQMELYSSNGIPVPKTSKGKIFGRTMDENPRPPRSLNPLQATIHDSRRPFAEPGYLEFVAKLNETNQIGTFGPTPVIAGIPQPFEPFILQDVFKIAEPGKYRLAFELRALKRKSPSIYNNFEPCYFPVIVELEIRNP